MKIYENGIYRDMTPEEIAEMEEARLRYEAEEKHRPLSTEEVQAMLIRQQVNTLTVDDATALRMAAFYPEWESGKAYTAENGCPVGYKVVRAGKLWKLRQEHTSQDDWRPALPARNPSGRKSVNSTMARNTMLSPTTAIWH